MSIVYKFYANGRGIEFPSWIDANTFKERYLTLHPCANVMIEVSYPPLNRVVCNNIQQSVIDALAYQCKNRVLAIKYLRDLTGAGLKESKDWLDANFPIEHKEKGDIK